MIKYIEKPLEIGAVFVLAVGLAGGDADAKKLANDLGDGFAKTMQAMASTTATAPAVMHVGSPITVEIFQIPTDEVVDYAQPRNVFGPWRSGDGNQES